jgi:uncharacterized protein DUF3300
MRVLVRGFVLFAVLLCAPTFVSAQTSNTTLKPEQLEQLVAPIALYPDALVAEILMASTYPLEVVEADRWAKQNKGLKGDALKQAADKQTWDDSIKSLTATPDVLDMMSSKLDWTQNLGNAVLAQQPDIMDAIQRLRTKAQANGKLQSTTQQKVSTATQANKQVIVIEPAEPNVVYVPYYNPAVVYGAWPYPAYPPYYFAPPGYIAGAAIATGLAFGAGFAVGAWAAGGHYWGGGFNWGNNNININRQVNINNINVNNNNWRHNPDHRGGVRYNNDKVAKEFGQHRQGGDQRMDFRGRDGKQVLNPSNDRRPGGDSKAGDRRPGGNDRPSANNRPGGGDRGDRGNREGNRGDRGGGQRNNNAFEHRGDGNAARAEGNRGRASMGGREMHRGGGGGHRGGGGGGHRGGGRRR